MKEAIGGGWLFTIVIVFIALFAGFISLSVNYSKCYKVKDEIINTIERQHGINDDSLKKINDYLLNIGYRNSGGCPKDGHCWIGFSVGNDVSRVTRYGSRTNFCVRKSKVNDVEQNGNSLSTNVAIGHPESSYYSVAVFFALNVPIINSFFSTTIRGETSQIYNTSDQSGIDWESCW